MTNLPTEISPHLRLNPSNALLSAVTGGVVGTMAPARISYRGSRFKLVDKDGVEAEPTIINDKGQAEVENNGVAMDIVIVGANKGISKIYYDQAYDPNSDTAPACFSDNGVAPSERAGKPQSLTCAACSHNVWGSAINPSTGKARQACNNVKKLAVVRYKDDANIVYALGLPGASLKPYEAAIKAIVNYGYRPDGVIWRISFDHAVAFPKLSFQPVGFLDAESMAEFEAIQSADEVRLATGADDVPMSAAAIEARRAPAAATENKPTPPVFAGARKPERLDLPQPSRPTPAKPVSPQPVFTPTPAGMPEHTRAALAAPPRKPGRPRKEAPTPELPGSFATAPTPAPTPAPKSGPEGLPAAPAELDDALSRAMEMPI
jgi:hypothetical protein